MLVDRYPPAALFALVPKLMADFEPVLRELDRLLDDDAIVQASRSAGVPPFLRAPAAF